MKKLLSMVLALCMLATSMSLVATAESGGLTIFKNSKVMCLDKDATETSKLTVDKNGNVLTNWPQGNLSIETETNLSGAKFKSVKIENTKPWFAGIGSGETVFANQILNKPSTTYEFWVKTDNLGLGSNERKNIFYTGNNWNYPAQFEIGSGLQSLFVRNGKFVYEIVEDNNAKIVGEYDISGKVAQYVHVVLTKSLNSTDSKINYIAYFDGKKVGEYQKTIGVDTANPDGNLFFFGGFWDSTDDKRQWKEPQKLFSGNVAEFNIYSDIATSENVVSLYNEKKDVYTRPMTVEKFQESKALEINPVATSVGDLFVDPTTKKVLSSWASGTITSTTETNLLGETFYSVNFSNQNNTFFEGDGNPTGQQDLWKRGLNKDEITYEFWLKTDDVGNGTGKKPIFYTGTHFHFHKAYSTQVKQSLYICGDELIYSDNDDTNSIGALNLENYKSQYVHAVISRTKNTDNSSVTYSVYFNGKLAGTKTKTVDNLDTVDGNLILFAGVYHDDGDVRGPEERFDGNIAQFNIYHNTATETIAKDLYDKNKAMYALEVVQAPADAIKKFKKAKKLELNKNATNVNSLPVTPGTTSTLDNWKEGSLKIDEEKSVSGETFNSVKISKDSNWFIGGDENEKNAFWKTNLYHKKTTWEFWLKTDDIDRGNKWRKNIFYIGTGHTYTYYFVRDARLSLYIQDGKLVFGRNDMDIASVDLGGYTSKYVHAMISREIDEISKKIKYVAYFNGNKIGEFTNNLTAYTDDPDGNKVFFGGAYPNGTSVVSNQRFDGNIAEFNVYHDFATEDIAKTLYEENKNTYLLYTTFEDCSLYDGDALKDNTVTFNFSTPIDEETFNGGIEVKTADRTLIYDTDYTAKADGKNIVLTIKNIDVSERYTVSLNDNLRAYDGAKIKFEEVPFTLTYEPLNDTIESIKKQLANITDFSKNNLKELNAFKGQILPLEKIGIDFKGETYYNNYCDIRENLTKIDNVTHSYSDDKLCINLTFEYPVSESYIEKIKYFEGRKDAEFDIQAVKNSENKIIGAKITADNTYKSSAYVQVTVDNGWLGQETKNFYIPTAVEIGKVVIKDNQNNIKASLSEITDGIANVSVSAVNNSFANGITGDFVFTVKDTTGKLVDIRTIQETLEKGETQNVSVKFENIPANAKDYEIEVYFWNGVSAMKPNTEKTAFAKTYGIDNVNDTTKDLKVVAIGGSITEGGNITTPFINSWDESREGKITFVNAGIGGTQSNYGSLRLQDDVLSHKPDVVIVEFILNDTGDQTCAWNVENIIRTCYEAEHQPVVMFLYVPDRRKSGDNYRQAENFSRYKKVLDAYGLTPLNAHQMAVDTVNEGTSWDTYVSSNDVHPNPTQGANIASLMWNELSSNISTYMKNIEYTDKMYYRNDVSNGTRVSASMTTYDENWSEKTPDNLVTEGYGNAATMRSKKYVATKTAGAKMSFEFSGTKLILTTIVGNTGRSADYVIKDANGNIEATGTLSNYVNLNPFENLMFDLNATSGDQYMELNLKNGIHTIEITVLDSDNANSEFGIADILIDEN